MWVLSKRKVIAWAAVVGVSYFLLKDWLSKSKISTDETDNGSNNGGGNSGGSGTGGSTTYKQCTDFPYTKGCSSSVVAEVQKCLGLKDDGKFGPNTEKTLTNGGYGTEITQDVYNKVKEKCGLNNDTNITVNEPETSVKPEYQRVDINPNDITFNN